MPAKRIFSIALALLLGVSFATPSGARAFLWPEQYDFEVGGLGYKTEVITTGASTVTVAKVVGCVRDCPDELVIPDSAGGYPVTVIETGAFQYSGATTAVIGNSVTQIKDYAFHTNPALISVTFGTSVQTIGIGVFEGSGLTSVTIPNSVTSIGNGAFSRSQLTSVTIPNSVTSIGAWAFLENKLTTVTIPNSVTSIGEEAFRLNLLTTVTIPNSVTSLGEKAFMQNLITRVTLPGFITTIPRQLLAYNQLTSVTIPNSVTSIGVAAFAENQITSLVIGSSVTSIGNDAFTNSLITTLEIPNSVTTIGNTAFANNQISSLVIGRGVTSIGDQAFFLNQLRLVTFAGNAPTIAANAFMWNGNTLTEFKRFHSRTGWGSILRQDNVDYPVVITVEATTKPHISGNTIAVGNTITANPGTWDGPATPTLAYQWYACTAAITLETQAVPATCSEISSATQSTFTVTAAQVDKFIAVGVTASSVGATPATWLSSTAAKAPAVNTFAPVVTGTESVYSTLTASSGTWAGDPTPTYAYQWFRCTGTGAASDTLPAGCTSISGATQATYAIDDPDYQKYLRVQVTATNDLGSASKYTAATAKVAASATENRSAPTISGSTTINATLTGNKGSWAGYPAPTYTYQWLRCTRAGSASDALPSGCTTISGATRTTYKLTTTDYGKYLRLKVVGTNSLGSDTKYSAATAKIAGLDPVNTVAPRITGTASVGSTVTGTEGTWTGFPDPTSTYQWFRCTSAGSASTAQPSGCTAISGATRSTYKLVAADKTAGYLRVRVTGTSAEGRAVRFSAAVKVQ